jgi:hypothetical protein
MNTDGHLHYVSDTNVLVQRFLCYLQDNLCWWYSICFSWGGGGDGEYTRMFKLQTKELSLISNVGNITSCRVLFKIFNYQYNMCVCVCVCVCIMEMLCYIKLNIGKVEQNFIMPKWFKCTSRNTLT